MADLRQRTVETYNKSARELAEYFRGIGPRDDDIDLAINLAGNPKDPQVLEIGCGDGRDAKAIVQRTPNYVGFDISEELIKLARKHVPKGRFIVADAAGYDYPGGLDVVYAFASLLHLDKDEVEDLFKKVHKALKPGGIFFISLKLAPEYTEKVKEDQFGVRLFYFYNPEVITELAGDKYEVAKIDGGFVTVGNTQWFEIALRKK
ncbi:MAG TPA: class I SAM-dependent methyltransferase [Candidatus Limnocylindria bacterium]|nr:class I SAM-dependent methyltransferase [Candidatus Limnocylindria bacterium]